MERENQRNRFMSSCVTGGGRGRIQVLIIEDHELVRRGLVAMVNAETDMACCGEFATSEEAFAALEGKSVDVVIVDVSAIRWSGLEAVKRIRKRDTSTRIIAVAMSERPELIEGLASAGAAACVMTSGFTERLLQAIRRAPGSRPGQPEVGAEVGGARRSVMQGGFDAVERQIVALIGQGVPSREIAIRLGLSLAMVDSYRRRIRLKLNHPAPTQLVEFCSRWTAQAV